MNYEQYFVDIKARVMNDLGDSFAADHLNNLSLSLSYKKRTQIKSNDQYRSRASRIPAYYNPNTHTVHLNIGVLEAANETLVENIYYHELVHASSHHARLSHNGLKILKSGIKIQVWDENDEQTTLHRGLNEGMTQYFANSNTAGGPAYKREVAIIGQLIQKIGMQPLKQAYFGPGIDELEEKVRVTLGEGILEQISELVDAKQYDEAEALLT